MKYLLMGTSSNFGNMFSMAAASLFLPFLPMLPTQILLNNFLYDLAQVTIPTDRVDPSFTRKPQRWRIDIIRDFMIAIGPVSSVFDFVTFWVLLNAFRASPAFFHTGWFVESLATQALVLFVIRTAGNPFRSRPSVPLAVTTVAVVVIAGGPAVHAGGGAARLRAAARLVSSSSWRGSSAAISSASRWLSGGCCGAMPESIGGRASSRRRRGVGIDAFAPDRGRPEERDSIA